ncbi:hypothetical protein JZ751_012095 [Albula glossodonta]|uniref:Transcription factor IIIB 50 kDa subunit n=1 Tax=Albula glossodonta TaxID=121402 RepID=A0A8T2PRP9_9TELE|nr:hypothetical protein JZ751_012095 [Albula glossodonta]
MASGQSCPGCGSSNLVDDALYSQSQLVCADCGSVVSEGLLTTTRSEEVQGTDVRYYESTAVVKQPCRNQIHGLKRVRALCRILRFSQVIEQTAESLFRRAYEHPSFLNAHRPKKELLGGSCVLLSSRMHNWPIAMGTICSLLQVSDQDMGTVYLELVRILNVEPITTSISDLLESHCSQYQLSPPGVPEVFAESTTKLIERATGLVELASDTWLVTGRHPVPILVAAVYLAWLSLNPCRARLKMQLGKFCKMAKVAMPLMAAVRLKEIKEVLCKIGKEIPWLRGADVEPRTVPTFTKDILQHRGLLMRKALHSFESELSHADCELNPNPFSEGGLSLPGDTCAADEGGEDGIRSGKSLPPATPRASVQTREETQEGQERTALLRDGVLEEGTATFDSNTQKSPTSDCHWAQRHLFVPPCTKNPRKRKADEAVLAVTGDEEISDSEIEEYLRTPQEMEDIREMQKKLMSVSDTCLYYRV